MVSELTCKPLWPPGHLYLPVNQKSFCSLCVSVRRSIFSLFTFISTDFHVLLVRVSTQDIRSAYHPLVIVCGKSKNLCFHILFIFFNFNHVNPTIGFSPYCHFSDCPTYHRWSSFTVFPMPGYIAWERHLCIQVLMYSLSVLWATPWILPFLFCFYYYFFFYMCKLKNMLTCFLMPTETLKIYVENAAILFMSAEKWEEMRLVRVETDMQQRSGLESNWGYCSLWLAS